MQVVCPFVKIAPGGAVCMIYELRLEICRLFAEIPGYEMLTFPEAYDRWYAEREAQKEAAQ